jgi:CDP-4-dehydro-6-deoxyglucose reductase
MPELTFEENTYTCREGESVLECLQRHDISVPFGCRAGVCQSCMMRAESGALPKAAQGGLNDRLRIQGYFLACQCRSDHALSVARVDAAATQVKAVLTRIEPLSANVLGVWMKPEESIAYQPGQFMNFVRDDLIRSYSLASVPTLQDELEFHVALMPGGRMSGWLHGDAAPGDSLNLQGPQGSCFYVSGSPEQPLLLVGTGTGLAPLYGIVRNALASGHSGPIHLLHGALEVEGLYLVDALKQLDCDHANFSYTACALRPSEHTDIAFGDIGELAIASHPDLKGWRVFLCGDPDTVKILQRKTFLAGASMSDILADAFLPST